MRSPPQNLDSERAVCAGVLTNGARAIAEIADFLAPADMAHPAHEVILQAAYEVDALARPVDYLTVQTYLKAKDRLSLLRAQGGADYLHALSRDLISPEHLKHHARVVQGLAKQRRVLLAASRIVELGYQSSDLEAYLEESQRLILEASGDLGRKQAVHVRPVLHGAIKRLGERFENDGILVGLPTGFQEVDVYLSGLVGGRLYILAARPGMGKTSLAWQMAVNCGRPALVFSLEMSAGDLADRAIVAEGRLDGLRFAHGTLTTAEWCRANPAAARLSDLPIMIDDSEAVTLPELRAKVRRWRSKNPGKVLLVVDYLQLLTAARERRSSREEEVAQFSRTLKALAKELDMPVVALAQLNRDVEKRADKRPMKSDLRESGAIEQDADVILFVYRDDVYHDDSEDKGIAEVIIAKNRFGPEGIARLKLHAESMRFE